MKKYLFLLLFFLPAIVMAQGPATSQPVAVLPFRMVDRYMVITASLTSTTDSLHFIFDTGAEVTTMSLSTANKLKLESKMDGAISGNDDVVIRVPTATLNVVYFGKTRLPFVKVYLETLSELKDIATPTIDGIIGVDLLKNFIVKIDYAHQQLVLYRGGKTAMDVPGKRLPMTLNFETPVIEAVIQLPDGKTMGSRYHFISGGEYGILFNYPFVEKYHLASVLPIESTDKVQDLQQELTYNNTTVPYLAMGATRLEKIPASYCKDVNDAGATTEVAGSIGYYIWRQFRTITINYPERELFIEK